MPCNCDHLVPSESEKDTNEVCKLIIYVNDRLSKETDASIVAASTATYPNTDILLPTTQALCKMIRELSDEDTARIVYNGMDRTSRRLADWWERHAEADQQRELEEKAMSETAAPDSFTDHELSHLCRLDKEKGRLEVIEKVLKRMEEIVRQKVHPGTVYFELVDLRNEIKSEYDNAQQYADRIWERRQE